MPRSVSPSVPTGICGVRSVGLRLANSLSHTESSEA